MSYYPYPLFDPKSESTESFLDGQSDAMCGLKPTLAQWRDLEYREGYEDCSSHKEFQKIELELELEE